MLRARWSLQKYRLMQREAYWKQRHRLESARFRVIRRRFLLRLWIRERGQWPNIASQIFSAIAGQLVVATVLIAALVGIEHIPFVENVLSGRSGTIEDRDVYTEFLGTAAQIAGVFLSLYFTTIGIVLSTAYASAPRDVRNLVVREQVGSVYFRFLALFGVLSWLLFAIAVYWERTFYAGALVIAATGIAAILSFVILGLRMFQFFDPSVLSGEVLRQIGDWVNRSTIGQPEASHQSFQQHFHRRANGLLRTYQHIVDAVLRNRDAIGAVSVELVGDLLDFLVYYSAAKRRMPSDSAWFPEATIYPDLLRVEYWKLGLMMSSGGFLPTDRARSYDWVEKQLLTVIRAVIRSLQRDEDTESIIRILSKTSATARNLAANWAVDDAIAVCQLSRELIVETLIAIRKRQPHLSQDQSELEHFMALIDLRGTLVFDLILGLGECLKISVETQPTHSLVPVEWRDPMGIVSQPRPRAVVHQLEGLRKKVRNGILLERRVVEPDWYLLHHTASAYTEYLQLAVDGLVDELQLLAVDVEGLLEPETNLGAVTLAMRGMEAMHKFEFHAATFRKFDADLQQARHPGEGGWSELDWSEINRNVESSHRRIVAGMATASASTLEFEREAIWPDLQGYVYTELANQAVRLASQSDDADQFFKRVFDAYFDLALRIHDRRRRRALESRESGEDIVLADILCDLLAISGVAVVWQEVGASRAADTVAQRWSEYLHRADDPRSVFQEIINIAESRRTAIWGSPRQEVRLVWKMELRNELVKRGVMTATTSGHISDSAAVNESRSPYVAALVGTYWQEDLDVIFVGWFTREHEPALGSDLPDHFRRFRQVVDREFSA